MKVALPVALASLLLAMPAEAGLYKWIDKNGQIHYSDRPPESAATQSGATELNRRGMPVGHIDSAAEIAAKERLASEQRAANQARAEQERRDKALRESYSRPEDIDVVRDRNIEQIEGNIRVYQAQRKAALDRLDNQNKRLERLNKAKKPIPPELLKSIQDVQLEITTIDNQIRIRQAEKEQAALQAEKDKARLKELKGLK